MGAFDDAWDSSDTSSSSGSSFDKAWDSIPEKPSLDSYVASQAGPGTELASGFLGAPANILDSTKQALQPLGDTINKNTNDIMAALLGDQYQPTPTDASKTSPAADWYRSLVDKATGTHNSTELNPSSVFYKAGDIAPQIALKPLSEGASLLRTLGETLGLSGLVAGGGSGGKSIAGALGGKDWEPTGEAVGQTIGLLAPSAAKSTITSLAGPLTEEQAMLQAFRASPKDEAGLMSLKDSGNLVSPKDSATPFNDTVANIQAAMDNKEAVIKPALEASPNFTIGDVRPTLSDLSDEIKTGAESRAGSRVVTTEDQGLVKTALGKLYGADNVDSEYQNYRQLKRQAADDPTYAPTFNKLENKINSVEISPSEVRDLRIAYDEKSKWDSAKVPETAQAYRDLRDSTQQKLLDNTGDLKGDVSNAFDEYSKLFGGLKAANKMAFLERKGLTQGPSTLSKAVKGVTTTPLKFLINQLGIGNKTALKPAELLSQAFGQSLPQQIANWKTPLDFLSGAVSPKAAPEVPSSIADVLQGQNVPYSQESQLALPDHSGLPAPESPLGLPAGQGFTNRDIQIRDMLSRQAGLPPGEDPTQLALPAGQGFTRRDLTPDESLARMGLTPLTPQVNPDAKIIRPGEVAPNPNAKIISQAGKAKLSTLAAGSAAAVAAGALAQKTLKNDTVGRAMDNVVDKIKYATGMKAKLQPTEDDPVIKAVIKQESGGNPKAESGAGAKGVMQLMDATGKEWHEKLGIEQPYDPFNKAQNMEIGTAYLNHLKDHYQGDLQLALAAYNGGIGRVDKLLEKTGGKTFNDIKGKLPDETVKYTTNIFANILKNLG